MLFGTHVISRQGSVLPLMCAPLGVGPASFPAPHAFCTRHGGVSEGPYWSLNVSGSVGDDPNAVAENWRRVRSAFPDIRLWVRMEQVHGTEICLVRDRTKSAVGPCDALLTSLAGVALCVTTADCVPILLSDRTGQLVAAVHAGWRGSVANIVGRVVDRMAVAFSLRPSDLYAILGPAIRGCCYVVGPEVAAAVDLLRLGPGVSRIEQGGKIRFDLHAANRELLYRAGVPADQVVTIEFCTACRAGDFFSHRRSGFPTGRQLSWVAPGAKPT